MPTNNDGAALGWVNRAYQKINEANSAARNGDTAKVSRLTQQAAGHMQDALTFVNSGYTSEKVGKRIYSELGKVDKAAQKAVTLAEKVKAEREDAKKRGR